MLLTITILGRGWGLLRQNTLEAETEGSKEPMEDRPFKVMRPPPLLIQPDVPPNPSNAFILAVYWWALIIHSFAKAPPLDTATLGPKPSTYKPLETLCIPAKTGRLPQHILEKTSDDSLSFCFRGNRCMLGGLICTSVPSLAQWLLSSKYLVFSGFTVCA